MNKTVLVVLFLLTIALAGHANTDQEAAMRVKYKGTPGFIYRLYLTDKQESANLLAHPTRFLSRRSVERRRRQGLAVDSTDLPVSRRYVRLIESKDVSIVGESRWQNTVLVRVKDSTLIQRLRQLPCVKGSRLVWQSPDSVPAGTLKVKVHERFEERDSMPGNVYGTAAGQITTVKGERLHSISLRGEGMMIAVIDGGFKNVDKIPAFQRVDAPKASYWLLRSEDQQTEQEVEEDYWTMAAEFADSVGCDLINSSLGYNEYDHLWMTYRLWQLDGRTAFVSRSASMLAAKGIILVNSAGNSGMGTWKKIGVPADADHIMSVGAVMDSEPHKIAPFSSVGPTQDQRIKPDVVAIGAPTRLVNGRGVIMSDMGTSFAAPVICGLMACLWQAMPEKRSTSSDSRAKTANIPTTSMATACPTSGGRI